MPDPYPYDESSRLVAEEIAGDNALALSVGELSLKLKRMVEGEFGHVRLRGEISGYKRATSGHVYMSLKDENAVIDAVMWKGAANTLPFQPQDGIEVIATGRLTTFPGRSKYQIVVERMELAGAGALMALFEKLKAKLAGEGLFDRDRKRALPFMPPVIGVVTSPTGAVIRDILHRLEDRCPTHVIVWPVKVQGAGSAEEVAAAVRGFDAIQPGGPVPRPDLVIVARGGGSIEDLWSFNEEIVVRAVADCAIPIISAVGHETDTTLCDYAADLRAPTPTAAAEIAVPVLADLRLTVASHRQRTERCARRYVERGRERLEAMARLLPKRDQLLGPQRQRADEAGARLDRGLERRVTLARGGLDRAGAALRPAILERQVERGRDRLASTWRLVQSLNPDRILERGYARITARPGGETLSSAEAARAADTLTLRFRDGTVDVAVDQGGLERPAPKTYDKPKREPKADPSQPSQPTLL
ncbi:exodeoxyribonuclease VII, large subunit [Sphingomonas sp. S17]|uniref:Exodeoxyribonuclease 7 large subunit n=6 Tax=Sphingomonas paucimobilis TaxID=13689 RepID=A0A7T3E6A3_SPHPI|nr:MULTISPECIES: exodeoxyribonuclease VII large subunit [Sphingomonas]EGI56527.1 exodeoxyribonuclease VII, large subunit [Sphingomonas sp. S17]MCM3678704.1 exodeoxyribonuclease VII large subunit [Sphingomonas paucimobilis]QBE92621.1 exodeoxyribonuclease VII large subunit [Sphingomonas paucimobilis]QPS17608.1 exodeoxyribonuclease VII large subunit [Sphingomonas paucimobilis]QPT09134.1 exodeoxyribonuclease VII large subunit [Sphingomonas paucimobilis]